MTEQQTTTKFTVGQHVHAKDFSTVGKVVAVHTIHGGEPQYTVEEHQDRDQRDTDTFAESALEPDDSGWLDIDSIAEIRAELESVCTSRSDYGGLHAKSTQDRIIAAGRISYLAGRLAWLEACDLPRPGEDERQRELAEAFERAGEKS